MVPAKKVARKAGRGTQYAALCYRLDRSGRAEILLVTSRGTGRWIPPKGWPVKGKRPHKAAAQEALEEAGVRGRVHKMALGRYKFRKNGAGNGRVAREAYIFPLEVKERLRDFKEKGQRKVRWFSRQRAAMLVREPKLKKIIRDFDPAWLNGG